MSIYICIYSAHDTHPPFFRLDVNLLSMAMRCVVVLVCCGALLCCAVLSCVTLCSVVVRCFLSSCDFFFVYVQLCLCVEQRLWEVTMLLLGFWFLEHTQRLWSCSAACHLGVLVFVEQCQSGLPHQGAATARP